MSSERNARYESMVSLTDRFSQLGGASKLFFQAFLAPLKLL